MKERVSKDENYLQIAMEVAQRSTCLRRRWGAVLVNDEQIVSTGYNGAPRGSKSCLDLGYCEREKQNVASGERYELCKSVHAEMNAIIHAGRERTKKGKLYLYGQNIKTEEIFWVERPCAMCTRVIINAGLESVIIQGKECFKEYKVKDWVGEM